jgi:hypothetical protein
MPRGFPFVHQLAREIYDRSGLQNDLTDFGQVPSGFETALTPLPINASDIRIWALGLASFPGGFGTGRPSDELNSTGGLDGHLPISQPNLLMMLTAIGVETGSAGNAWDRIPEFSKFTVNITTWRFAFSRITWATRIGFVFGEVAEREALWVDNVTWFSTPDIPTIFQVTELAVKRGKPLPSLDSELRDRMIFKV